MQDATTTQVKDLFLSALGGQNYSDKTIRAYGDDIKEFLAWVAKSRVDWEMPKRFTKLDIIEFMNRLASMNRTGVTRVRKLASIRKFFYFMEENSIISQNPAQFIKGARREEKEPNVLYKEEY